MPDPELTVSVISNAHFSLASAAIFEGNYSENQRCLDAGAMKHEESAERG